MPNYPYPLEREAAEHGFLELFVVGRSHSNKEASPRLALSRHAPVFCLTRAGRGQGQGQSQGAIGGGSS